MLVIKDISSTNSLVNSHAFGSSFTVLTLIWSFNIASSLIFCQKALHYRLRLWCLHVLPLSCSVNSKQEMKNLRHSSFHHTASLQALKHGQRVFPFHYSYYLHFFQSMNIYWKIPCYSSAPPLLSLKTNQRCGRLQLGIRFSVNCFPHESCWFVHILFIFFFSKGLTFL